MLTTALTVGAGSTVDQARQWLDRLDQEINARSDDVHYRVETWLAQAEAWRQAGQKSRAYSAVQSAIEASFAAGQHDDDRQLVGWLDWLQAAADGSALSTGELLDAARTYASRLVTACPQAPAETREAAEKLVTLVWPYDPSLGYALAEFLCNNEVIDEATAIESVLTGAATDERVPVGLVATAVGHLYLPLVQHPSTSLTAAIAGRDDSAETRLASEELDIATAMWSVPAMSVGDDDVEHAEDEAAGDVLNPTAQARPPANVHAILAMMRRATASADAPPGGWSAAIDHVATEHVTPAIAAALLEQASRLRLDAEPAGTLAAMAASVGHSTAAAATLSEALARTPAYGWLQHYDGGRRLNAVRRALRDRDPALIQLAAQDLAGALITGGISGRIDPGDLYRITEVIAGPAIVAHAWSDVQAYLDIFAPATLTVPDVEHTHTVEPSPTQAMLDWIASYLGHPVRIVDFGARLTLQAGLLATPTTTQDALAATINAGGWGAEAALHTLHTGPTMDGGLTANLTAAIENTTSNFDGILRYLGQLLADTYQVTIAQRASRQLPSSYRLTLPSLLARSAPEVDAEGIPHLDLDDPQQAVAPFDLPIAELATRAGLDKTAVMYRAASLAVDTDEPWLRGGHRSQAEKLKTRGQRHTYRPWAYMTGRRALGLVLGELLDAGQLGVSLTTAARYLDLVDETLIYLDPAVRGQAMVVSLHNRCPASRRNEPAVVGQPGVVPNRRRRRPRRADRRRPHRRLPHRLFGERTAGHRRRRRRCRRDPHQERRDPLTSATPDKQEGSAMPQYLLAVHGPAEVWDRPYEENQQTYTDTAVFNDKRRDAGVYVFAGGLRAPGSATVVRRSGDGYVTTDGPYTETKEHLGGFWIIDAADLDEALDWARQASTACGGPVEVRPFDDEPPLTAR